MAKCWLGLLLLMVSIGSSGIAHATVTEAPDPLDIGSVNVTQSGTADSTLSATTLTTNVTVQLRTGGDCPQFQINIKNTGDAPLDITSFTPTNVDPTFTFTLPNTPLQIAPNSSIVASAPKHRDWQQVVEVKKEGEVTTIEIDLVPQSAP